MKKNDKIYDTVGLRNLITKSKQEFMENRSIYLTWKHQDAFDFQLNSFLKFQTNFKKQKPKIL